MRGLYAIVDLGTLARFGIEPLAYTRAVLRARPAAIQLRAKELPPREILAALRALIPMCRCAGVPVVANDRPELAALAGCDMVHVGQDDMPVERVRGIAPMLGIGVSTHNLEQLAAALALRPTYVAFGPVYATVSKPNAEPVVGVEGLRAASAMAARAGIPLVAIGGITIESAFEIAGLASAVAVISGLLRDSDSDVHTHADGLSDVATFDGEAITTRARAFQRVFGGAHAGDTVAAHA